MTLPREEETKICMNGDWSNVTAQHMHSALIHSLAVRHKLPDWIRYMNGMSGRKYRYFINNLLSYIPNPRYLEIGSWKGSTACAAIWGNQVHAVCIDNWSQFLEGNSKEQIKAVFEKNIQEATLNAEQISWRDQDFRTINYAELGKFNVYLFDGPHEHRDHYDGLCMAQPALEDNHILIVDDWNNSDVKSGTIAAVQDLKLRVTCEIEIFTRTDNQHPWIAGEHSDWHNGYWIALIAR
jgi:Methyltransferase domain